MISKEQANRLRGLIKYSIETAIGLGAAITPVEINHAREEHRLARERVYEEIRKLTEPPTVVEKEWRHDVADNGNGLHIVMRGKRYSLCTQVDMEKRAGLKFVGAWDDGEPPTCEHCLRVWAAMRRDDKQPNNYFDPDKEKS